MSRRKVQPSLSSEAYEQIRHDLIEGTLAPGTKLIVADLQLRYGLGVMPLREALNRLSSEQFVLKHEQRGFSVPPLDIAEYVRIQNARIVIETAALRDSINSHSPEWEDRVVLAQHHLAKASKAGPDFLLSSEWALAHANFHRELISGCDNTWLLTFAEQLFSQSERYRVRRRQIDTGSLSQSGHLLEEHKAIADAAVDGDVELAIDRLVRHYKKSVETVVGETIELDSGLVLRRQPLAPNPSKE